MPKQSKQSWYAITAKDEEAEIMIYDEIGCFGVAASDFVKELKGIKARTINLHLNTPGGSVFDGLAIYNAIKAHKSNVVTHIDGIAASIGSVIAIAGDDVRMAENAMMMIHNPRGGAFGESGDMRKVAEALDKMKGQIAGTYTAKTGKDADEVNKWMDEETWFTAQEAMDAGLVDSITEAADMVASFDVTKLKNAPDTVLAIFQNHGRKDATETKELSMSITIDSFKAFAAEHPEAVKDFIDQGYVKAKAELTAKPATATQLREVFPADADKGFCMDMLTENATVEQARAKYIAAQASRIAAAEKDRDDFKAKVDILSAGQGAIGTKGESNEGEKKEADDVIAKAKADGRFEASEDGRRFNIRPNYARAAQG